MIMYRIWRRWKSKEDLVLRSWHHANSSSIVVLLDALSHVMCPTCITLSRYHLIINTSTYLVHNIKTVACQKQKLSKSGTIMCRVELSEAEEHVLLSPPHWALLDPVAGHCKICISIICLPCITCQANLASHSRALSDKCKHGSNQESKKNHSHSGDPSRYPSVAWIYQWCVHVSVCVPVVWCHDLHGIRYRPSSWRTGDQKHQAARKALTN